MRNFLLCTLAAGAVLSASAFNMASIENNAQMGTPLNAKQAPKEVVAKLAQKTVANRAPKKINSPVTVASDLLGGYSWTYQMSKDRTEDPASATVTGTYTQDVLFYDADDATGTFKIAGMFDAPITATLDLTSYDYPTFTISDEEQVAYTSNYGACTVRGLFYYEGDTNNQAGWYYTDNLAFVFDDEILWASNVWMVRIIASGQYEGYSLTPYYMPASEMVDKEGLNGIMTHRYNNAFDMTSPVSITEDENYVVTVNNFGGFAAVNPVTINLEEGYIWTADATVLFTNDNGSYVLYGTDGDNLFDLTGTGTETTLTFDTDWTGYDTTTNYWLGQRGAGVITLLDGEFEWPSITAVNDINTSDVASVKYINAQGMTASKAFDGMNIQVITYTDGTSKAVKVIK
ncbi:MAG: hypothetical protein IJ775_06365 [Muribaculaceae bacterium]|nr:hypothetical protein [Muribaculaceae bacterium]